MLLQDTDPIPPVLPIEVQSQAILHVGVPWAAVEGAGALISRLQEAHIAYLGLMYHLTDRHSTPVY